MVIIGAGASWLMCAAQAGKRGRRVKVLDQAPKPGRKILISGGGRCNFTNRRVSAQNYISSNPHFVKSALSRYRPQDFITLVQQYGIPFSEWEHGQLFCTGSAMEILEMLLAECRSAGVCLAFKTSVNGIERQASTRGFRICTAGESMEASSLVIATGYRRGINACSRGHFVRIQGRRAVRHSCGTAQARPCSLYASARG